MTHRFDDVSIIAPLADKKLASYIDSQFIMLDINRSFGKYYYGISNVGLITVVNGRVVRMKNYDIGEMDHFEEDLKQVNPSGFQ